MKASNFLQMSIPEILTAYQNIKISPLEVAKMCISQYENHENDLHAWVVFSKEKLRQQAKAASQYLMKNSIPRSLEGIPVAVKDVFNTIEFPTCMGSPIWQGFQAGNEARVVSMIKWQGALIPGKTTTAEFAVHSLLTNTVNPHNKNKIVGTSSSGSACAVASGMVPVAFGTQTAGSIMRPASYCGIFGFKPSFGLIPRTGVLKTADTLDTIGFLSNHVANLPVMFEAMHVKGHNYPISHHLLHKYQKQNQQNTWRVGFVKTPTWEFAKTYAKNAFEKWIKKLSLVKNIIVEETKLPAVAELAWGAHDTIYTKSLAHYFQNESLKTEKLSLIIQQMLAHGQQIPADKFYHALEMQNIIIKTINSMFHKYDILVSLSTAGQAPALNEPEKPDPCLMWTMSHVSVIGVPQFVSSEKLPFGMQVVARKYGDLKLLKFIQWLAENHLIPQTANPQFSKNNFI